MAVPRSQGGAGLQATAVHRSRSTRPFAGAVRRGLHPGSSPGPRGPGAVRDVGAGRGARPRWTGVGATTGDAVGRCVEAEAVSSRDGRCCRSSSRATRDNRGNSCQRRSGDSPERWRSSGTVGIQRTGGCHGTGWYLPEQQVPAGTRRGCRSTGGHRNGTRPSSGARAATGGAELSRLRETGGKVLAGVRREVGQPAQDLRIQARTVIGRQQRVPVTGAPPRKVRAGPVLSVIVPPSWGGRLRRLRGPRGRKKTARLTPPPPLSVLSVSPSETPASVERRRLRPRDDRVRPRAGGPRPS